MEPIANISSLFFSFIQMGSGVPQYLSRESDQSFTSSNQLPNLPSPISFGCQFICLLRAIISSLYAVERMNQLSLAKYIIGLPVRQQCG